jgi:hypothetical protein
MLIVSPSPLESVAGVVKDGKDAEEVESLASSFLSSALSACLAG